MSKPTNEEQRAFINEIIAVCQKHKLWIDHEDSHGAFLIEPFGEHDEWQENALRYAVERG